MKTFDVKTIQIDTSFDEAFNYIANAQNLPEWTSAFKTATDGSALMETSNGSVEVILKVHAFRQQGTIDWFMTFPDGNVAKAYSRLVDCGKNGRLFSFILLAPPVPLEQLEGALEQQSRILSEELLRLRTILSKI